ncbi:MAG TPA: phage portal protein, partial [candidate division Zixibacteria bacterium]|nr:phage portal protein [candidate division Zixibacteria bacterium]
MLTKSRAKEWVERTLLAAKLSVRESFKDEIAKRIDYYNDRQLPYLLELLERRYRDADALALEPEFVNIIKTIVDGTALVYRSGAGRVLVGEPTPEETALWDWLMSGANYEATMKTVHRMVKLCRTVLVKPSFRGGRIRLDILTPDQIDVVQDEEDPTEARAVIYTRPRAETLTAEELIFHYWDSENFRRFTADGTILRTEGNPENINPYGTLPFVRFTETLPLSGFFVDAGDDLTVVQDAVNLKLVQLNHLLKMQSFSVPVLIGYEGKEKIVVAPGKPICIPLGGLGDGKPDFKFVSPNPAIGDCLQAIRESIVRLSNTYHISSANFSLSGTPRSGFALVMEN